MLKELWDDEIIEHWSLYNVESTIIIYLSLVFIFLLIVYHSFFSWLFVFFLFRYILNYKLNKRRIKNIKGISFFD